MVPDDQGDLVSMIQRQLIKYYVTEEFGSSRGRGPKLAKKELANS
jgi:hypothetical protein